MSVFQEDPNLLTPFTTCPPLSMIDFLENLDTAWADIESEVKEAGNLGFRCNELKRRSGNNAGGNNDEAEKLLKSKTV